MTSAGLHPLAALREDELKAIAKTVKNFNANEKCSFRRIYLEEPPKAQVVPYLEAELAGTKLPPKPRRRGKAFFYFEGKPQFIEALVDIEDQKLLSQRVLKGLHGPGDDAEMIVVQNAALASPLVKKELERLQLPEGCQVIAEPWPYGTDDTRVDVRMFQVWFFLNLKEHADHPGANFYGHPLDFVAAVEATNMTVVNIERMPMGPGSYGADDAKWHPNPDSEYAPEFIETRKDLKPLNVLQPEGVSFTVTDDEIIEWQKWKFTLNFDLREGMILRNVTYEGRPIFYRLALSEMTVPYGDPRNPLQRKSAYDLGEAGAGQTSNNLQLGCDCLGVIKYFDGLGCDPDGNPVKLPNSICLHEQDGGLGSKHTNVRTGRADVTRLRELVLQLIITVGNYEYAVYWIFDTAGVVHWEVRATGIMSVTPVAPDANPDEMTYGTIVAPGVFAPHHQHIFNIRADPAIDGYRSSSVVYEDVVSFPRDAKNPHGVGFGTQTTKVEKETAFNLDWNTNRTVKLVNKTKKNPLSNKPIGYKVLVPPTQLGLADPTSMHNIRGEFVNHHIHVTKHADDEMYAAGDHPWQSTGGQGGCRTWSERARPLEDDAVCWITIGFTHIARAEDWPLMPVEVFRMHFKPVGFFDKSPAHDMPPSTQAINKSELAKCDVAANGHAAKPVANGEAKPAANGDKQSCCSM